MTNWQNIKTVQSESSPCPRWGHSMCAVQDKLYIFGGYQNSKYLNDLWQFDLSTLQFQKITQSGTIPIPCSNFTMNYDEKHNRILLFGGGAANKQKLNSVYIMEIDTFTWTKIEVDEGSPKPWQRSYHCAEIIGTYLVIFGGEFFHDLDDTWIMDLQTFSWKQLNVSTLHKPAARKFASSFAYKNRFYVTGGCCNKYQSLANAYYLDFNQFIVSGDLNSLNWTEIKMTGVELITRWGHISATKENTAIIFGGRHLNKDLQNLVQIDLINNICTQRDVIGPLPKGRRRPSICLRNNSLFCFSGFDGSYIKDFSYISLLDAPKKQIEEHIQEKEILINILNLQNVQEDCLDVEQQVLYLQKHQYHDVEEYLRILKFASKQLLPNIDYQISEQKIASRFKFYEYFCNGNFKNDNLSLYVPSHITKTDQIILSKMFLSFVEFGKVIIPKEVFNKEAYHYFFDLLEISRYYCINELQQICKNYLVRSFSNCIATPKFDFENIIQMCQMMTNIDQQYGEYACYLCLRKIIDRRRKYINSIEQLRIFIIKAASDPTNTFCLQKIMKKYSFELQQMIMNKRSVDDDENIEQHNANQQQAYLQKKNRKSSTNSTTYHMTS